MFPVMGAVISGIRFNTVNLVAEGSAVVARVTSEIILAKGKRLVRRGLASYRLANGRIVEDAPIETPDLTQELAAMMPPPAS